MSDREFEIYKDVLRLKIQLALSVTFSLGVLVGILIP